MANSVFENVDDVLKLGGDNFGSNLSTQLGLGGDGTGAEASQDGIAAALGGDTSQINKQLSSGGSVGDTESNDTSVTVVNIS
ncbi:MAG: hypothetical protein ACREXR_04320 [Gammaproteobacteria bacterium]